MSLPSAPNLEARSEGGFGVPDVLVLLVLEPVWIYFEGSTSSMRATVLLQMVCNALVRGQRLFLTMSQVCQLEGGFW